MPRPTTNEYKGQYIAGYLSAPATLELEFIQSIFGSQKYDAISTALVYHGRALKGEPIAVQPVAEAGSFTKKPTESRARLSGCLSAQATTQLGYIRDQFGSTVLDTINTALVLYGKALRNEYSYTEKQEVPKTRTSKRVDGHRKQHALKAIWCQEVGGTVDDNICHFTKYEVALNGETKGNKRSIPLADLPDDRDSFMGFVLGGYDSLAEAERAAQKHD